MPTGQSQDHSWQRLVLDSLPKPAWLTAPGQHTDVVLSTRVRIMRNLRGQRFPHHASHDELRAICALILEAAAHPQLGPTLQVQRQLSPVERDYLVACRLVSADFKWAEPGRSLLIDARRAISLMTNEEDHIRLQCVTAGWSVGAAERSAQDTLDDLSQRLEFAQSARFGYLSASPFNCGKGRRLSALFHLIGLAHTKRLPKVLEALAGRGLISRGLFGESSRALGAFVQVSVTAGPKEDFFGAGSYLLEEELGARSGVSHDLLEEKAEDAKHLIRVSRTIGLDNALRVLAWLRWAAAEKVGAVPGTERDVDQWFASLILRTSGDEQRAGKSRADLLRAVLGL